PFIGVPCHRRAADCCGENSTSKEEWNKELGTRHREQHNQRLLFTPGSTVNTELIHRSSELIDLVEHRPQDGRLASISHTYEQPGTYAITLTITNFNPTNCYYSSTTPTMDIVTVHTKMVSVTEG
ncbi:MAG: hypothetical protein V2A73_11635, partial [Pseudomonadota bacterium]